MYDFFKSVVFFFLLFLFIIVAFIFGGCKSTKILSDNGTGVEDFRNKQSEIRNGEIELAVSGSELKSTSDEIGESIREIKSTSSELEQSIGESAEQKLGVGEIIQQVRKREISRDKLSELGIGFQE